VKKMGEIDDDPDNDQDNESLGRLNLPSKGKDHDFLYDLLA